MTCLQAALQAGCDAVYFGLERLNMRAVGAENFSLDQLPEIGRLCAARGVKRYLALNTILFERELAEAEAVVAAACGQVDAVVCTDLAVMDLCRRRGVPFHVSTQCSAANSRAARMLRGLGAARIILARECTLPEIRRIREASGIAVEAFVHGAMCVSLSGHCLLAHEAFGKSGNRGECPQLCRREYLITDVEEGTEFVLGQDYVLSARDLCTLPFIEKLVEAGIDAFKIEGRSRSPDYVHTVVGCYRQAIDAHFDGSLDDALKARLVESCRTVFNRGLADGFFFGRPIAEFARGHGSHATRRREQVGLVQNYYRRPGVVEILVQNHAFGLGDTVMIEGPTTGLVTFQPTEIRQDEETVGRARPGVATVKVEARVRRGDKVYVAAPAEEPGQAVP